MWTYNTTNELYHHGVKGMKWGVRRAIRKQAKADYKSDRKKNRDEFAKTANRIHKQYGLSTDKDDYRVKDQIALENAASKRRLLDREAKAKYKSTIASTKPDPNSKQARVGRSVVRGLIATGGMAGLTLAWATNKNTTSTADGVAKMFLGGAATAATGAMAVANILGEATRRS